MPLLPSSPAELKERQWETLDFVWSQETLILIIPVSVLHHWARVGTGWLSCGDFVSAKLERKRKLCCFRSSAFGISRYRREHGQHGGTLHCSQTKAPR